MNRKQRNKKRLTEFNPIIKRIKRYLYYEANLTYKYAVKHKEAVDLFLKDQNLIVNGHKVDFLIELKKSGKNKILNKRCVRKPRDKNHSKNAYKNYLRSEEWKEKREQLFSIRGKKCEDCSGTNKIEVHHLHYKNIYNENMEDLKVLCQKCHTEEHKRIKEERKRKDPNLVRYKRNGVIKYKSKNEA